MNRRARPEYSIRVEFENPLNPVEAQNNLPFLDSNRQSAQINPFHLYRPEAQSNREARSLHPVCQQSLLRQQALAEARQGFLQDAIAILDHLIDCFPVSAVDYNNRGLLYQRLGNLDQAIQDYNDALRYDTALDGAYNNRANCYAAQGQKHQAIVDYNHAIDLNPYNLRARINLAITLREIGYYSEAITTLDTALQLCRDNYLAAHIYAERGRVGHLDGDWNCAFADYHRAIAHLKTASIHSQAVSSSNCHELARRVTHWLDQLLEAAYE